MAQKTIVQLVADIRNKLGPLVNLTTMVRTTLQPVYARDRLIKDEAYIADANVPAIKEALQQILDAEEVKEPTYTTEDLRHLAETLRFITSDFPPAYRIGWQEIKSWMKERKGDNVIS